MNIKQDLKIIFAGTPVFADVILQALIAANYNVVAVYTQPDKPAGRGQKLMAGPVKQTALSHHIPVFQPKTLRNPETQAELAAINADLMIVAAYGLILPQAVLDMPRLGCINVHGSILPRWRGAAPIQRALLAGDTETGITIMQMEAGLDTGPMLHKLTCPILADDTSGMLHDRLATLGAEALLQALQQLQAGKLIAEKQDDSLANYANKLEKEEAKLDWHQPAEILARQVRAFNPWPIAYCLLQDQPLRIWQAKALPQTYDEKPGTIVHADKHGIDIAAEKGTLRLLTLQLPGQKALSAADMLNGRAALFTIGQCLL
jgi:methionyl-tRNA formyltransferase